MRIVSPLLRRVVYPSLARAGLLRRAAGRGLAVVTYHGVLPQGYEPTDSALDGNLITAETLRRQLRLLKARYHVIAPDDLLVSYRSGGELPPLSVLLTCDDGLQNNLSEMLPVLQEEGVRCLFFVTGASATDQPATLWYEELFWIIEAAPSGHFKIAFGTIEISGELGTRADRRPIWWNAVKRLSQVDTEDRNGFLAGARAQFGMSDEMTFGNNDCPRHRRFDLLRRADLLQLASAGMTIGAHTLSHPMLSKAPPELAWAEIVESRVRLEAVLGKPVWAFAYPFGDNESVTPQVLAMAMEAGYEAAFLNIDGGLGAEIPRFAIPRVNVTASMNLGEFEAHVAGFHESLRRWARRDPQGAVLSAQG
jgi:peptidoglycan/xylan/chitin deacetylase (PgdA/CDA1 family)